MNQIDPNEDGTNSRGTHADQEETKHSHFGHGIEMQRVPATNLTAATH
jgi:hypothetical protein